MRVFMDTYKVKYPVGRDAAGTVVTLYAIEATPTSLFIDKAGRLAEQHVGGMPETDFVRRIEALLS